MAQKRNLARKINRGFTMKISTGGLGNVRPSGVLAATILLIGAGLSGCNPSGSAEQDAEPQMAVPKVSIIEVQPESVTVPDEISGRTAAYMIAQVRPQVGGIINERRFAEGSLVEEGQVLYQIDPAIFEADLASAEAAVAESEANLEINRLTVTRYRKLLKSKSISQQDYDGANAEYRQARAAVAVEKAALQCRDRFPGSRSAKLDMGARLLRPCCSDLYPVCRSFFPCGHLRWG
jgi:membrane fusion protein (multidrug efflux system)